MRIITSKFSVRPFSIKGSVLLAMSDCKANPTVYVDLCYTRTGDNEFFISKISTVTTNTWDYDGIFVYGSQKIETIPARYINDVVNDTKATEYRMRLVDVASTG